MLNMRRLENAIVVPGTASGGGRVRRLVVWTCKFNVFLSMLFMPSLSLKLSADLKLWLVNPPDCAVGNGAGG